MQATLCFLFSFPLLFLPLSEWLKILRGAVCPKIGGKKGKKKKGKKKKKN